MSATRLWCMRKKGTCTCERVAAQHSPCCDSCTGAKRAAQVPKRGSTKEGCAHEQPASALCALSATIKNGRKRCSCA
eukprot:1154169-Pelagomonas_calceolata.AAC.2